MWMSFRTVPSYSLGSGAYEELGLIAVDLSMLMQPQFSVYIWQHCGRLNRYIRFC